MTSPASVAPAGPSAALAALTVYGADAGETELFRALAPGLGVAPVITALPATAATADLARGSRCVSVGHKARLTPETLDALRRAGVAHVTTRSIGSDHIDVAHAARIGMSVGTIPYSPDGVADFTVMLLLMALRHAPASIRRVDAHDYRLGDVRGRELRDLTVGVVGTGRIGGAVVDRLRGFGCRILAADTRSRTSPEHVPLDDLVERSDVVTLHAPLDATTHHLLDRRRIGRMPPGAVVVNTGRGGLVDTAALVEALEAGRLGAAGLDVVEGEEGVFYADRRDSPPEDPLLARLHRLPNVVLTPHSAFHTDRALADVVRNTLLACLDAEGRAHV
jgi:D-specific alpha-keto acid dehydrogenase